LRAVKKHVCFCAVFLISSVRAQADIGSIRTQALPQETAVLSALDDARSMEPYSKSFAGEWKYPVSKDDVKKHLERDLSFLQAAGKDHPDNLELLLLTGLVAHYGYNVDVDGSFDAATDALGRAAKLAPSDMRPEWFRGGLLCQTSQPQTGASVFLNIEKEHAWDQLPIAFWNDYMECATVAGLPSHVLRADDHLKAMHAPDTESRDFLVEVARKRFDAFDPSKKYETKQVWSADHAGQDTRLTSTLCGVQLSAHGDWSVDQLGFNNGTCVALFSTGPYKAVKRNLRPSILLLVQRAKDGESLSEWAKKFADPEHGKLEPDVEMRCPSEPCFAMKADGPGLYGADGSGKARMIAMQREQPLYPGLLLETGWEPPQPGSGEGLQYFRPSQVQARIPGKLNYLLMIDVASSIEEPGMKDFQFFLEHLKVE
jgi:hypothetical protein